MFSCTQVTNVWEIYILHRVVYRVHCPSVYYMLVTSLRNPWITYHFLSLWN